MPFWEMTVELEVDSKPGRASKALAMPSPRTSDEILTGSAVGLAGSAGAVVLTTGVVAWEAATSGEALVKV